MDTLFQNLKNYFSDQYDLKITDFELEKESAAYNACQFRINNKQIIGRLSKVTPKKKGQFVTFYKRNKNGIIEPFYEKDNVNYFIIFTQQKTGIFVFPKSILIKKGILSTIKKEGKRAFRVYLPSDELTSKQAMITQKWQSEYFFKNDDVVAQKRVVYMFLK